MEKNKPLWETKAVFVFAVPIKAKT